MIYDIPSSLDASLRAATSTPSLLDTISGKKLFFTGCGTAYLSGWLAAEILSIFNPEGSPRALFALELPDHPVDGDCVVIGISNSGITKTTADALASARRRGAHTVALTHSRGPVTDAADSSLIIGNSPDVSRCHTKCFTDNFGALLAMSCATARSTRSDSLTRSLQKVPSRLKGFIEEVDPECRKLAEANLESRVHYFTGFGPGKVIAEEAALKVSETLFQPAFGYELEQFLHGPWVSLDDKSVLFVYGSPRHRNRVFDLVHAASNVGASVVCIGCEEDVGKATSIRLPEGAEPVTPLYAIVPAYLYVYYASVLRGRNPDMLRYQEETYWKSRLIIFPPGTH
ncbi:MAG: SIS domain-containing protein [Thermoprotei archaeon]